MQYFRSSRVYGNYFLMEKPKGQPIGAAPAAGWLKDRWPKLSTLMEERRWEKTIRADLNHQKL